MIKEKLAKLIDFKNSITYIIVISYTVMVFMGIVEPDYKDLVFLTVTFYFAKNKKEDKNE